MLTCMVTPNFDIAMCSLLYMYTRTVHTSLLSGQFNIPVSCLVEPRANQPIRKPDKTFISSLKHEMLTNLTGDVAPIVGLVRLKDGEAYDEAHPEAFIYETIGGNHSRIALQELLGQDDISVHQRMQFRSRIVSVYTGLTDEQAQHLAH